MSDQKKLIRAIERFWLTQPDIELQKPITENEITRAQEILGLPIPPPLIDCLKIANGFHDKDKNGFRFWSVAEICPIQNDIFNKFSDFLQFADYLDSSWVYAVSCTFPYPVILVGTNSSQKIRSFNFYDFLTFYIQDHPNLYPQQLK